MAPRFAYLPLLRNPSHTNFPADLADFRRFLKPRIPANEREFLREGDHSACPKISSQKLPFKLPSLPPPSPFFRLKIPRQYRNFDHGKHGKARKFLGRTLAGTRSFPAKTPRRKDFWRNDAVFTGTPPEIRENSCQFAVKNFP